MSLPVNDNIVNHHCTCIQVNSTGIMIEGASGSGKTSLALGLLDAARIRGADFSFVCDDQALLTVKDGQLWASAPKSIAGKVEIHGSGIADIEFRERCKIDLVCQLIDQKKIERLPAPTKCERLGITLDYVQVPLRPEAQAVRILLHRLSLPL